VRIRWTFLRWGFLAGAILYYFSLPDPLFEDPYSTVLQAHDGRLLTASIARDGQWRFPEADTLSQRFATALIHFEDKRFYSHPGVDPLAFVRATTQNISKGRVVSGGSTITMQLVRLMRKGRPRTLWEKGIEIVMATRLELKYSKDEILRMYSSHAPFGGNVVGLEAACWRYFGRTMNDLSWAEASLLAVLPNAPALIHPARNRERLLRKRDLLLDKLNGAGVIDSMTYRLAKDEELPEQPFRIPRHARHLMSKAVTDGHSQQKLRTSIDYNTQIRAEQIIEDHHTRLAGNQIHNAAAIVIRVSTGEVIAYVGNVAPERRSIHGNEVDVIQSPRSTGSILKPFLYAAMLDEGRILPNTLLPDVPTLIAGFAPQNFSNDYDGAVSAHQALTRSLNVPAVHLLLQYRYEKFHSLLKRMGMTTLRNDPDHYGLSLILGGAEGTLWELSGMYASMARSLTGYFTHPGKQRYESDSYRPPVYLPSDPIKASLDVSSVLSAASVYQTFSILTDVYRPGELTGWKYFQSTRKIAWKTGTSFGFRDGWSIGVTPEFVVGVWVGNADGEGRPGLTGTEAAAPIMFDIFSQLPTSSWFDAPRPEFVRIEVCSKSGMKYREGCEKADTLLVNLRGVNSRACPYHVPVHLSLDGKFRVHSGCTSLTSMITGSRFVLPPVQEYYYRSKNLSYQSLPPYRSDCLAPSEQQNMEIVYPKESARIFIPRELAGAKGHVVVELAHRDEGTTVYWHLDGKYLGLSRGSHRMPLQVDAGRHVLVLVDEAGEELTRAFEVGASM
jgi:penicillin-binding protein 1C